MKKTNLGFTLIELLAVVLMIGILTSLALPQYRRSVQRAESMEAMVNLRSLFDSAKRYRSEHSQAPVKLQGLDITFFDATNDTEDTFQIGKFQYYFEPNRVSACRAEKGTIHYCLRGYYKHPEKGKDILTCQTEETNGKFSWLCPAIATETELSEGSKEYILE